MEGGDTHQTPPFGWCRAAPGWCRFAPVGHLRAVGAKQAGTRWHVPSDANPCVVLTLGHEGVGHAVSASSTSSSRHE